MKPLTDTNTILNALQKVATDHEADLVEALAIKAGFWWKCLRRLTPTSFCNWINTADDTNCGNCGIIRRNHTDAQQGGKRMSNDTIDETEDYRRARQAELNTEAATRKILEIKYGQVWDSKQLQEDFMVLGFMAPFVVVSRKVDGKKGSLEFQHGPRFYFNWTEDKR